MVNNSWRPAGEIDVTDSATWNYTERDKHFWPPEELTKDKNIKLIVDVGANCGFSTGLFAHAWPKANIIGFELDVDAIARARSYLTEFGNRVVIVQAALGWPEREEQAIISSASPVNTLKPYEHEHQVVLREETVQVISLDRALRQAGLKDKKIDILKMDIEGSEWEILNDGGKWSERVSIFIVETHSYHRPYQEFEDKVKELGFNITFNHKGQLVGYK